MDENEENIKEIIRKTAESRHAPQSFSAEKISDLFFLNLIFWPGWHFVSWQFLRIFFQQLFSVFVVLICRRLS